MKLTAYIPLLPSLIVCVELYLHSLYAFITYIWITFPFSSRLLTFYWI